MTYNQIGRMLFYRDIVHYGRFKISLTLSGHYLVEHGTIRKLFDSLFEVAGYINRERI